MDRKAESNPSAGPASTRLVAGPLAALLLLANDAALIRITFGTWAPATPRIAVLTVGAGLVVGATLWALLTIASRCSRRFSPPTATQLFVLSFVALYGFATWFRFESVGFLQRLGAWAPALLTLCFVGASSFVLQRIGAATNRGWLGLFFAGLFVAFFLVGNREIVDRPTSPEALVFDLIAFLVTIVSLLLLRSRWSGDRRQDRIALLTLATGSLLLTASLAMFGFERSQARARLLESRSAAQLADPPHVVLLVFDTMRGDVFADVLANTPEGQAFAEAFGSVTWFDQAVAASSWTGPSMSTVLTGLHPLEHQVRGSWQGRIPTDEPILAEFLRDRGYQTLGVVANRSLIRSIGTERGFQIYEGLPTSKGLAALGRLERKIWGPTKAIRRPESWFVDARRARMVLEHRLGLVDPTRPVFLWYHLMDVHQPLRDHSDLPPTAGEDGLDDEALAYRNSARFALAETAEALRVIQDRLPTEDTLTLVISDHGEMLSSDNQEAPTDGTTESRAMKHGHAYYDSVIHVPLGVQLPGRSATIQPDASASLVSHLDIVPTIMDAVGAEWPRPLTGCSLLPLVNGPEAPEPEHCHPFVVSDGNIFSVTHSSLRTTRLKLMASPNGAFEPLLYDLALDPGEQIDRAGEEVEATTSALALLRRYWAEHQSGRPPAAGELDAGQIETLRALGYL